MIHAETVERYPGTLSELAVEVGNLRYDALAIFLRALAEKLAADAAGDESRGRPKLAASLRAASTQIGDAATAIEQSWVISAPHMK